MYEIAICLSAVIGLSAMGQYVSVAILGTRLSRLDNLFVGYLTASSVLSGVYCLTQLRLDQILIAMLLLSILSLPWILKANSSMHFAIEHEVMVFLLGIAVSAFIVFPSASNILQVAENGGTLLAHIDLFAHAAMINQLSLQQEIGTTQILFSGIQSPIYHYGIYSIPSVLSKYLAVTGLDLVVWFVLPYGLLMLWSGIHGTIRTATNTSYPVAGMLGILAIIAADTSRAFSFNNALFDLPYLLCASPGATYGAAIVMLAIKILAQNGRLNFGLVLSVTFWLTGFRVLFIPLFILFSYFVGVSQVGVLEKRKKYALLLLPPATLLLLGAYRNDIVTGYHQFMLTFPDTSHSVGMIPEWYFLKAAHVIVSTLGGSLLILFAASFTIFALHRNADGKSFPLQICLWLVVSYFCTMLAPIAPPNGDFTEFVHRPFAIFNLVCATLLISYIHACIAFGRISVLIVAGAVLLVLSNERKYGFPKNHEWHRSSYDIDVSPSLVKASRWLLSQPMRVPYLYVPVNKGGYTQYPEAIISTISLKPAFISRPGFFSNPDIYTYSQYPGSGIAAAPSNPEFVGRFGFYLNTGVAYRNRIGQSIVFADSLDNCGNAAGFLASAKIDRLFLVSEQIIPCLTPVLALDKLYVYLLGENRMLPNKR